MLRQAELANLVTPAQNESVASLQNICVALPHVLNLVANRVCTQGSHVRPRTAAWNAASMLRMASVLAAEMRRAAFRVLSVIHLLAPSVGQMGVGMQQPATLDKLVAAVSCVNAAVTWVMQAIDTCMHCTTCMQPTRRSGPLLDG